LQGEEQKKLDVLSNEVFVKALVSSGRTVMHSLSYTSVHVPMFIVYYKTTSSSFSTLHSVLNLDIDFALAYSVSLCLKRTRRPSSSTRPSAESSWILPPLYFS